MVVSLHPAVAFAFFTGAIVLSVLVDNLLWQAVGLLCAAAAYLCIGGRRGWRAVVLMVPVALAVAAINPLFNLRGETVLFMVLGSRPYTLEALAYGASTGMMVASVLLWFLSFSIVMTSDRLMYLFGRFAPALTLVLTMVLRLVPTYQREARQIVMARAGLRRSASSGTMAQRIRAAADTASALVSAALEGSIVTADSMGSRGFGTGRRTSFARYGFMVRDGALMAVMALLGVIALGGILSGAAAMGYFPTLACPRADVLGIGTFIAFAGFLLIPAILTAGEVVSWSIWRSRI